MLLCFSFLTTWLHLLVRSRPQQISDSGRPALVFILLYLCQPKCQNKYNLLKLDSVPNYTPQRIRTPNIYNETLSRCFYSLRKFIQSKNKQTEKNPRSAHKNLSKPGILLAVISKPEKEESSVTPTAFHHGPLQCVFAVSVEGFCNLMICPTAHERLWSWARRISIK